MSTEQRDNNLGIDPNLRNTDPLAYEILLQRKLQELRKQFESFSIDQECTEETNTSAQEL